MRTPGFTSTMINGIFCQKDIEGAGLFSSCGVSLTILPPGSLEKESERTSIFRRLRKPAKMPFFLRPKSLATRPGTSPSQRRKSAGGKREDFSSRVKLSPVSEASEESDSGMVSQKPSTAHPNFRNRTSVRVSRSSFETTMRERNRSREDSLLTNVQNKDVSEMLISIDKRTKHYLKERAEKIKRKSVSEKEDLSENTANDGSESGRLKGRSVIRFTLQDGLNTISDLSDKEEQLQKSRAWSALPSLTRVDRRRSGSEVDGRHSNNLGSSTSHKPPGDDDTTQSGSADQTTYATLATPRLASPTPGNRHRESPAANHSHNYNPQRELAKLDLREERVEKGANSVGESKRTTGSGKVGERGGLSGRFSLFPDLKQTETGEGEVTSQRSGRLANAHRHSRRELVSRHDVSAPLLKATDHASTFRPDAVKLARASQTASSRTTQSPRSPLAAQHHFSASTARRDLSLSPLSPSPTLSYRVASPGFFDSLYASLSAAPMSSSLAMNSQDQLLTSRTRRSTSYSRTPRSSQMREPAYVRLSRPKMTRPTLRRPVTQTATTRKSNMSGSAGSAVGTAGTSTSGESQPPETLEEYEKRLTVEKCMRWMETLPDKFTGLHIVMSPGPSAEDS